MRKLLFYFCNFSISLRFSQGKKYFYVLCVCVCIYIYVYWYILIQTWPIRLAQVSAHKYRKISITVWDVFGWTADSFYCGDGCSLGLFRIFSWNWITLFDLLLLSHFSRVTLCDPIDGSPPGSPVPGILQARTLEWVAISFSNAWKWKAKVKSLSRVWLLATPWNAAYQAPPSMGFSRQQYWSGVPLPSPIWPVDPWKYL